MENEHNTPATSAVKDFFMEIGSIIGLYVSAGSLVALLYGLINYTFPDKLAYYADPYSGSIKFAIASLVVIFPIYLLLGYIIQKGFRTNPENRNSPIRKFLVYLTLFVASVIIIGDLVALINTFLGGEITTRFLLKALTVFVVAGLIFGYYLRDLKRPDGSLKNMKMFATLAGILVLASIVLGFSVMGSPMRQRALRFDADRVSDLQTIQWQVVNYWQSKGVLPKELSELEDTISGYMVPLDPRTDVAYVYKVLDKKKFELCATFEEPTQDLKGRGEYGRDVVYSDYGIIGGPEMENWKHDIGETCFERDIDEDLYPIRDKATSAIVPIKY